VTYWQYGHIATLYWLCCLWHMSYECRRLIWLTGSWQYHHKQRPGFNPRQVQSVQKQSATRTHFYQILCFTPVSIIPPCSTLHMPFLYPQCHIICTTDNTIGQVTDVSSDHSAFIFGVKAVYNGNLFLSSWTAWFWRWEQCSHSKFWVSLTVQHSVTWTLSSTAVTTSHNTSYQQNSQNI
jgi:hypothetical protein